MSSGPITPQISSESAHPKLPQHMPKLHTSVCVFFCFFLFLEETQRSKWLTDFDKWYVKVRVLVKGSAFWGWEMFIPKFWPLNWPKPPIFGHFQCKYNGKFLSITFKRYAGFSPNLVCVSRSSSPTTMFPRKWSKLKIQDGRRLPS